MSSAALALRQVRFTNKAFWRNPASAFFTFAFPLMFLVIFTALLGNGTSDFGRAPFVVHIKDATITHRRAGKGQQEYLIIKLNDVTITAVSHGGSEDQPYAESVSLKFAKVDLEYKPQRPDGSLDPGLYFKFDLKANKVG